MNWLVTAVAVPILTGLICFAFPKRAKVFAEGFALLGSFVSFAAAGWLFLHKPLEWTFSGTSLLRVDALNGFMLLAAGLFGLLITLFSLPFMRSHSKITGYYGYLLLALGSTFGVLLSNHWILLLVFWGFLGILLYLLVLMGGVNAAQPAKKTLVLVGGSDIFMLLGIAILTGLSSTYQIHTGAKIALNGVWIHVAFFSLLSAVFAKAGIMPLHTWIPDVAETAPLPVTAYLPAALDKLLGIYLLARMCLSVFTVSEAVRFVLMVLGTITILAAVMMALVQHDYRKLLGYHAVSQAGYMVLGIASGNAIGFAGGLFHMLNNSLYKSCLFLSGGAVQHRVGTADLDRLGGVGKSMPLTFLTFFIAAASISGIPPFNGFASKWMIYQGLIEAGRNGDALWMIWLLAALFGSALTAASFMKLVHAIFLGVPSPDVEKKKPREVGIAMAAPMVVLAALCIVFGVFAYSVPIRGFLVPITGDLPYLGIWSPKAATVLLFVGLVAGGLIYLAGRILSIRRSEPFVGGEALPAENRVTGVRFYQTIRDLFGIRRIYSWAENRAFDLYEQGSRFILWVSGLLRRTHTGVLTQYLGWFLFGMIVLLTVWMRR
jgi:formate hydrogenlyase subunit 3/multisubunit Na+/H+ antiporter MnhD subunit